MTEKDDWRLLNLDGEFLKKAYVNPTDGEEICKYAPQLKHCEFCFEPVQDNPYHVVSAKIVFMILRKCLRGRNWMAGILNGKEKGLLTKSRENECRRNGY